ncbi:MAG: CPBP family intramembrane metalloprotease [Paraprevotella sp.]|nr:CPBP family intramembrane metalloprotease [Paraprevotella sp.]
MDRFPLRSLGASAGRMVGMVLLFLAMQCLCMLMAVWTGGGASFLELPASRSALWMLLSSLLTIIFFPLLSWVKPADFCFNSREWPIYIWAVAWMLSAILPANLLSEALGLDNLLEEQMLAWMHTPWGVLNIVLAAPLAEELIFRAGFIGTMRSRGCSARCAVVVSALLFGLIHGNPAQMPVAFLLGLMLGYVYVRGGSLWPCWFAHAANNLVGVLTAWLAGDSPSTLVDTLGGVWPSVLCTLLSLLLFISIGMHIRRRHSVTFSD